MIIRDDLVQGSPEWHAWRAGKATASQAATVMNCALYHPKTWADLRMDRMGLSPEPDDYTKGLWARGHAKETEYRFNLAEQYKPVCVELDDTPFAASLDGIATEFIFDETQITSWLEVKAPRDTRSKVWKMAALGDDMRSRDMRSCIPDHYWWQMVHQAGVLPQTAQYCRYMVYIDIDTFHSFEIPAEDLRADWPTLKAEWERFLSGVEQGRSDLNWRSTARRWQEVKSQLDDLNHQEATLRSALIGMSADGQGEQGCGVKVSKVTRKGTVDWKQATADLYQGNELETWSEGYRKPDSVTHRLSRT